MPIIVKDYTWKQTEDAVFLRIPRKGSSNPNMDVLTTAKYVKVSFPPFFFECFLFEPINDIISKCTVVDSEILFELVKCNTNHWPELNASLTKQEQSDCRNEALEIIEQRGKEERERNATLKHENKRFSVRKQMKMEEVNRKRIENIKISEKSKAMKSLDTWKKKQQSEKSIVPLSKEIFELKDEVEVKPLQPIRASCTIAFTFTPREFPTPCRESTAEEEEKWLQKQRDARKICGIEDDDLRPEEKNPEYLKDKGDSFFKAGNYLAAINAYTHGIKMNRAMPALYSNRAAAHLALRNLHKAVEDSSRALELLNPPVPANESARVKCHVRRGTALCHLELFAEGLSDYQAALKINPSDHVLVSDAEKIRRHIQGN